MTCQKCKTEFEGNYCPKCGTRKEMETNSELFKQYLYDASEDVVAILGNDIAQSFISTGVLGNGFAILSDKRLYFKGKCLIRKGKGFYSKIEEKSVDITDITGTGFVHRKAIWAKVMYMIFLGLLIMMLTTLVPSAILSLIFNGELGMILVALVDLLFWGSLYVLFKFIYKKYTYSAFEITYAGGGIAFDMHWITDTESKEFQRNLNLLKDKLKAEKIQGYECNFK